MIKKTCAFHIPSFFFGYKNNTIFTTITIFWTITNRFEAKQRKKNYFFIENIFIEPENRFLNKNVHDILKFLQKSTHKTYANVLITL